MIDGDWITDFLDYSKGLPAPEIFKLFSAITGLGAALERRVWILSSGMELYPTFYTLLVGPPGTGKSVPINHISAMWYSTKTLHVAPHSVTRASLVDELDAAKRTMVVTETNQLIEYHSLQIAASEFGILVPAHDLEFLNFLNHIYDNSPNYRESRRTYNRKVDSINPQINILAGTQPEYLAALLPEGAWGMGFMTRMLMVYSEEQIIPDIFDRTVANKEIFKNLVERMIELTKVHGEVDWEIDAKIAMQNWMRAGRPPIPQHTRLEAYNSRRHLHLMRMAMVSAASGAHPLLITLFDFQRALDWLILAETTMPNVFRSMVQKSDSNVINELHMFAWGIYMQEKKLVHEARLTNFLRAHVTTDKIPRILDIAVRANIFDKAADAPLYRPRPKSEHGLE